jgi:DNA-binding CsgD family transcriptional regulator
MPIDAQGKLSGERQMTPSELQILDLICQGHSTRKIAGLLGVSVKTAACQRQSLMEKAGVHDAIRLFRWALVKGHVRLDEQPAQIGAAGAAGS